MNISEAAFIGRNSLGPTVVNRATLNAAWSAIRGSESGFFDYETSMKGLTTPKQAKKGEVLPAYQAEGKIKVRMTPLIDAENMKLFREKARAAIGFASDPMDEGGLKNRNVFFDEIARHLFKWEVYDPRTGEIIEDLTNSYNDHTMGTFSRNRRAGLVKIMSDINSKEKRLMLLVGIICFQSLPILYMGSIILMVYLTGLILINCPRCMESMRKLSKVIALGG